MSYELFDGKYNIETIASMPYRDLLDAIEREKVLQKELAESRAGKKLKGMM